MSKARDIASAIPAPSTISSTELGYLDGVTSAIQTQINTKSAIADDFAAGKNKIINGDFGIWQRGVGPFTAAGVFGPDRFRQTFVGTAAALSTSQQTFTPGTAPVSGYEGTFFARYAVTAGSDTSGSYVIAIQSIEDVRQFAGQTITVSFWAKAASGTPGIGMDVYQDFGSGGSATPATTGQKVTISTSWTRYSLTFTVPSISGKTIGTSSSFVVRFWFSAGSTLNANSGSLGTQSGTFDIWGVQAEAASSASPFQTATGTKQGELAACQRYYYRNTPGATGRRFGVGMSTSATNHAILTPFPVSMRTQPTALEQTGTAADYSFIQGASVITSSSVPVFAGATTEAGHTNLTSASGGIDGYGGMGRAANATAYLGWSAEL